MTRSLDQRTLKSLLARRGAPALSLYQPTHRSFPERQQDPIRFRHLLHELETSLEAQFPRQPHERILQPLRALLDDTEFWNHGTEGLAVFAGNGYFELFRLQRPVQELAIVNDRPFVKPLLRMAQSADRYQVLCLSLDSVRLFEGNRYGLAEMTLHPDVPRTLEQALGDELTNKGQQGLRHGFGPAGERGDAMQHGSGGSGKQDEIDKDRDRFFRAVDRAVTEHHSRATGLPLILAALPQQQSHFRQLSHNEHLVSEAIDVGGAQSLDELRERSWQVMQPRLRKRIDGVLEQYGQSHGQGLATDRLDEIGSATQGNRIATLMVEAERHIPAHVNTEDGSLLPSAEAGANAPDLLEELTIRVMELGGEVIALPAERMPTHSGAAAIYRY